MNCPACDVKAKVIDSKYMNFDRKVVRKHRCKICGKIFFSVEKDLDRIDGYDILNNYYNTYRRGKRKQLTYLKG